MAKSVKKQTQPKRKNKNKGGARSFRFRATDVIMEDANVNPPNLLQVAVNSSGVAYRQISLSPMGVVIPYFTTSAGGGVNVTNQNFGYSHLPWLKNTSMNFQRYRILSATLIVDGRYIPSTSTGTVNVYSTVDSTDITNFTGINKASTAGSRLISLGSFMNGPKRIPLNVDTSIKKITQFTHYQGTELGTTAGIMAPLNTVNDLCFSNLSIAIDTNDSDKVNQNIFTYQLEYDVEFYDPISAFVNR